MHLSAGVLFVITAGAGDAATGVSKPVMISRTKGSIEVDDLSDLRG